MRPVAPPPVRLGKYRLLERLGVGGMAEVFLALDPAGGRVAVKRLLPTLAERGEFVEMFLAEARLGAAMDHRGIVRVLDAGRGETGWYMALEWVPGRDLRAVQARLARRGRRLPPPVAAYVARELCAALEHVHRGRGADGRPLGVSHRDVSPRNVLCSWEGGVKLADFGIARADEARPAPGESGAAGSAGPEGAGPAGPGSDVRALAAVLREMLTGERLRDGTAAAPPSRWSPALPPGLEAVVLGALAPGAGASTPPAEELARALAPFADPRGERSLARLLGELFPDERRRDRERVRRLG